MATKSDVHWGIASNGHVSLCGEPGVRRTAIRLVTCEYCQNRIDEHLQRSFVSGTDMSAFAAPGAVSGGGGHLAPIPMVLHCPECKARHIDEGEFATKPHHTHACQGCGLTWRPAVVATVGVRFLPGFKNEPVPVSTREDGPEPGSPEEVAEYVAHGDCEPGKHQPHCRHYIKAPDPRIQPSEDGGASTGTVPAAEVSAHASTREDESGYTEAFTCVKCGQVHLGGSPCPIERINHLRSVHLDPERLADAIYSGLTWPDRRRVLRVVKRALAAAREGT